MFILFAILLAGCAVVLALHLLANSAPGIEDVLAGLAPAHTFASTPSRTTVQVRRDQVEGSNGPLADALRDAPEIRVAGRRFARIAPGQYRYRGLAADAALAVRLAPAGQLVEVDYSLQRKW